MLYDADCGFCTASALRLKRWGTSVEIVPLQSADLASLGVSEVAALQVIHLVDDAGRVSTGHLAIARTLLCGDRHWMRAAGRVLGLRGIAPLASRVYTWVAAPRHRLPGGSAACEL